MSASTSSPRSMPPTMVPAHRTASRPGPVAWMIGSKVQLGTRLRPPHEGASHAGPECAMPQMRSFSPSTCAPMSDVSKGTDGLRRRSSSACSERLGSNRSRSAPSFGVPPSGSSSKGVSRRRKRIGRPSSDVSDAWKATESASHKRSCGTRSTRSDGQ